MASWADLDMHCATGCSFLCEYGTCNNFSGHAFFLPSAELCLPKLMVLVGSCTVDIADDTTWLKLFYWPFHLKIDLPKAMAAACCKVYRCSWHEEHSDCILYSTVPMQLGLLAMLLGAQVFMSNSGCVQMNFTELVCSILSSRSGLFCSVQAWGSETSYIVEKLQVLSHHQVHSDYRISHLECA